MPKYFCEYCGIYLTHSSPGGRKQHSHGRKHINNKIEYYSQFLYEFQQNAYSKIIVN
jgi:U1 small nuclear ribonucleoprotein C